MESRERRDRRKRLIFKSAHDRTYVLRHAESRNYYRKRRLKACDRFFSFSRVSVAFPFSSALSRRFFATKLRERAARVREDDEFDTLARSLARSTVIAVSERNA